MNQPRVLVGCERSGVVAAAFRRRGWYAMSCDLHPSDQPGDHYQGDVIDLLERPWDLFIAFPDCTYLCSSGMHWTTRGLRDPALTEKALVFVRQLMAAPIPYKALENPTGAISTRIRKYDQRVQPYDFGDDASKGTCLWLERLPLLTGTSFIPPRMVCRCAAVYPYGRPEKEGCPACGCERSLAKPRWANQTDSGQNRLGPSEERAALRSRTYDGIGDAMSVQWGDFVVNQLKNT